MIALEDLKGKTEKEIKLHLATEYASEHWHDGDDNYNKPEPDLIKSLKKFKILLAYESVGNWGCDSSSLFFIQEKETGKIFEINGGHNSTCGFEGQFSLEEINVTALKARKIDDMYFTGGYDNNEAENKAAVHKFIQSL